MSYLSVHIIVLCCYLVGEIYKFIFEKKQKAYKLIPIILSALGGILIGVIIILIISKTNKKKAKEA